MNAISIPYSYRPEALPDARTLIHCNTRVAGSTQVSVLCEPHTSATLFSEEAILKNPRKYGEPPFTVAVVHGGPGAAGEMTPVARELSGRGGVLEPIQTAMTLEGQVGELAALLREHALVPVTLIGYSWGAWLGVLLAARQSDLVRNLILVGSGPFEAEYASRIEQTRLSRLSDVEKREVGNLIRVIGDPDSQGREEAFARFGELYSRADTYEPLPEGDDPVEFRPDIFEAVWPEGAELRRTGRLIEEVSNVRCPVVAIHGDYDPHPAEGVEAPLSRILKDFRFVLLSRCGHKPWVERHARDEFYRILSGELA
jgi:pimeloyl-ACP methyl ester carboxylesterase